MKKILTDGAAQLGITLDDTQTEQFIKYARLLKEWNEKINLTAITDDEGIASKHFLDSITAVLTGKVSGRLIDVGTGAGFPAIPIKIVKPQTEVVLLDSLNKRLNFLNEVCAELGLENISTVHARAEDGGRDAQLREKFDVAVSRAVANMSVLCELCLPFVRVGGYFLALKGPLADEELAGAKRAIAVLGGEVESVMEVDIPFTELNHKIIIVKKVRHTPMQYPRKAGIPTKTPIDTCYNLKKTRR